MDILKTIISAIALSLSKPEADIKKESNLVTDLKLDELDMEEIHLAIEDAVGVTIVDADFEKFNTIDDIFSYVTLKLKPESGH